jgi:acyl carrier protein
MDLEEEFKISMDENEMGSIKTVGDLIAYIAARPLADPSPA